MFGMMAQQHEEEEVVFLGGREAGTPPALMVGVGVDQGLVLEMWALGRPPRKGSEVGILDY